MSGSIALATDPFFSLPFSGTEVLKSTINYLPHLKASSIPEHWCVCEPTNKKSLKQHRTDFHLELYITILSRSISSFVLRKKITSFLTYRHFFHINWSFKSKAYPRQTKRISKNPKYYTLILDTSEFSLLTISELNQDRYAILHKPRQYYCH